MDARVAPEELATALVDIPMRNATEPEPIEIDGRPGVYLEWSVPNDLEFDGENFPGCDAVGDGHFDFRSWTGKGWASTRYQQGPGQVDRLWIREVDGKRLVIDGSSMPDSTDAEVQEIFELVEAIRFVDD